MLLTWLWIAAVLRRGENKKTGVNGQPASRDIAIHVDSKQRERITPPRALPVWRADLLRQAVKSAAARSFSFVKLRVANHAPAFAGQNA
jgi:hypothetical protein